MRTRKTDSRPTVSQKPIETPIALKSEDVEPPLGKKNDGFTGTVVKSVTVQTVAPTRVPHSWAAELDQTAKQTGAELKNAGKLMHEAGDAVDFSDPVGLEAHAIGTDASNLGAKVEGTVGATHIPAGTVHADIDHLHKRAEGLVEKASTRNFAQRAMDKLSDGASSIGRALKGYTQGVAKAVDYEKNIDALGDEDSYTLGVEAFLMALGATVEGAASIEVERKDGKYTVAMEGEAAAGVFVDFGINIFGVGAEAFASATLGRGMKYELQFDSAADAKKAVGLMLSRVGKKATGRELSDDEKDLFKKNLGAVELSGSAAVNGWAMLNLPSIFAVISEASIKGTQTIRIELGERPALVLSEELSSEGNTGLHAATKGEVLAHQGLGTVKGEAKAQLERRIELDQRPDLTDPVQTLKTLKKEVDRSRAKHAVNLSYEGHGGVMGSGGGFSLELALSSDIDALQKSGAITRALKGDLQGALEKVPTSTEIEGTFQRFADYGVDIGPAVYFMSFGAGIELEAMRKDVDLEHQKKAKAPAKDAYVAVKKWLDDVASGKAAEA